jgi:FlaA1/EpsC-like NDP-sugar epimerase
MSYPEGQKMMKSILRITPIKRLAFFFLTDSLLIALSLYASFWLRFDGDIPAEFARKLPVYLGLALIVKITILAAFGMYSVSWRFSG